MTSKRETVFAGLFAELSDADTGVPSAVAGVRTKRNEVMPERLAGPDDALIIQQDGGDPPGPLEVTLSPVTYTYLETILLEVAYQAASGRDAAIDEIFGAIGAVVAANRTVGGADDVRVTAPPKIEDRAISGASQLKVATVGVDVLYTTTDPLG